MKLSDGEKLNILMLCDIYKHLKVKGEFDPEFISITIFNGCSQILQGTIGLVEKSGRPDIIVDCMRPRGEPDCLWIMRLRLTVVEAVDYDPFAKR
jgi:hypothetical protein